MAIENDRKKLQMDMSEDTPQSKTGNNRMLILLCAVLVLLCLGLLAGLIVLASDKWVVDNIGVTSASKAKCAEEVCNSPPCVIIAGEMMKKIDTEVNPCDNFYEYACGGWLKKTVIAEDKSSLRMTSLLRQDQAVILKELFERKPAVGEIEVIKKLKNFYSSCVDTETIENRDSEPLTTLLNKLGGWPILGNNPGGYWNQSDFDLESLMSQLVGEYNNGIIIEAWVGADQKNSTRNIIKLDQDNFGMGGREYYIEDNKAKFRTAYVNYFVSLTTLLGASEITAKQDIDAIMTFETLLANMSVAKELRRDVEKLYHPTTLGELKQDYPEFNWTRYFDIAMPNETKPILDDEYIVNFSPEYVAYALTLAMETPPRVLANYLLWRITLNRIPSLSKRFRDVRQAYVQTFSGTTKEQEKWKTCVSYVGSAMKQASGRLYVDENFAGTSKANVEDMINQLSTTFKGMLEENKWMDKETKAAAREKVEAIREQIGYPDWMKDDDKLTEYYERFPISEDKYFENILNYIGWYAERDWLKLREPVDKDEWFAGAAEINAYYSPSNNQIVFPAGILQPPFYHKDFPSYLNYGGIGYVIGHEITHGFDDRGRKMDKDGNLQQWWTNSSIENFKERAQCIVDQYDQYIMPSLNKTVDGFQTQGENIADIGGLNEAFKAFTERAYTRIKLPGFESFTPEQLFFLNFGQTKCSLYRPEALERQILHGVHSPGRYRAIGVLHNSPEFAKAFNCPEGSYMNQPIDKQCTVW